MNLCGPDRCGPDRRGPDWYGPDLLRSRKGEAGRPGPVSNEPDPAKPLLKVYVQYSVMCVDKAIVTEVSNQSKCIREHGLKQGEGTRQNKTEGGKWNDRGQEGKWYRSREIAPIYSRWKHTHSGDREWTITLKTGGSDISNLLGPTDATTRWYSKLVQPDVTQQGGTTSSTRGHTTW